MSVPLSGGELHNVACTLRAMRLLDIIRELSPLPPLLVPLGLSTGCCSHVHFMERAVYSKNFGAFTVVAECDVCDGRGVGEFLVTPVPR
jgi:hypothetical protein